MKYARTTCLSFLFVMFIVSNVAAWEVTTHQQLTRMALKGDSRSENLKFFISEFNLGDENYRSEGNITLFWITETNTEKATGSYVQVAEDLTGRQSVIEGLAVPINLGGNYKGLIETGSILEDSALDDKYLDVLHARFMRHFYDPEKDYKLYGCYGLKLMATCAKEWALNGGNANEANEFSWTKAYDYFLDSIIGESKINRKLAQAKLFVSIGFLSHLMEDMTQAAHVRDDIHGGPGKGGVNIFEKWANVYFNTMTGPYFSLNTVSELNPISFDSHFTEIARFTHNNFFSDDTFPWLTINGDHTSPSKDNTIEEDLNSNIFYLLSNDLQIPDRTKLGFHVVNNWWKDTWCLQAFQPISNGLTLPDNSVLEENAKTLFPRAISAVEGLINFFFRARISATIDKENKDKLIIKNITRQNIVNPLTDVEIKSGARIFIYYETSDGKRLALPNIGGQSMRQDLENNESIAIEGLSDAVSQITDASSSENENDNNEKTIFVVIHGLMGGDNHDEDRIVAATKFVYTPDEDDDDDDQAEEQVTTWSNGDPHICTLDGLHYDFQAAGEFIYLESVESPNDMTVQVRQEPWKNSDYVSINTAIAMTVASDIVEIYSDLEKYESWLYINGTAQNTSKESMWNLPNGGQVKLNGNRFFIEWPGDNSNFYVKHSGTRLSLQGNIDQSRKGMLRGIAGNYDENQENELSMRDGTVLNLNPSFEELYQEYAPSWRISQTESLFTYADGEDTTTYTIQDFPKEYISASDFSETDYKNAEQICLNAGITAPELLQDCILDVALTNDHSFADNSMNLNLPENAVTMNADCPESEMNLTGVWEGTWNQTYSYREYHAKVVLQQDGNTITGTSRTEPIDQPQYHGLMTLTGSTDGSKVTFQENEAIENFPFPGSYWCLKNVTLVLSCTGGVKKLTGTWEDPGCNSGEVVMRYKGQETENLLTNSGFESNLAGWITDHGFIRTYDPDPLEGSNYLGGCNFSNLDAFQISHTYQTINLITKGFKDEDIDSGKFVVKFGGWQTTGWDCNGGNIKITFSDEFSELNSHDLGWFNSVDKWMLNEDTVNLPIGTRIITYHFYSQRCGYRCPGYLDDAFVFIQ